MAVSGREPATIGEWAKLSVNEHGLPFGDDFDGSSEKGGENWKKQVCLCMNWNRTAFWGITYRQLAGVLGLYGMAMLMYDIALSISQQEWSKQPMLADAFDYVPRITLEYTLKLLFTVPIWYLLFVRLREWPLLRRVALHLVLLPLFIVLWQNSCYLVLDALGVGRMRGNGQIWDTYIGALFYLVQFGIFHAYAYYRDYQRQRIQEAELRELAVKSELTALKAQLNPHFLYNVFNTISATVPPELEHTRELLADLADLFRYQLQASKTDFVTVRDEVAFLQKYLDLEKARFGDRLRVAFEVPEAVLDAKIPPMLLQPLVENAVRHGIAPLIEGGEVRVKINYQEGKLHVMVADTGAGMNGKSVNGHGVGLANTRLRLEKMYGNELVIKKNEPHGVRVDFEIPA
jgi:two-component system, LytTR family, sensor kinase